MNKVMLYFILLVFCFNPGFFCSTEKSQTKHKNHIQVKSQKDTVKYKFYTRDSLFINRSIYEWIDYTKGKGVGGLMFYPKYYNPYKKEKPTIYVDSIVYSPDKLKLVAFIVIEYRGKLIDESLSEGARYYQDHLEEVFYDGHTVIGYREYYRESWNLYDFTKFFPSTFENYTDVSESLRRYNFEDLHKHGDVILRKDIIEYKYNVDEPEFWTEKCVVWQKGLRIPGCYNFQTAGNVTPESIDPLVPELNISYPDSLLKLFELEGKARSSKSSKK